MDTTLIKSLYSHLYNTTFPVGLAGEEIDEIELVLFDADLAAAVSQLLIKNDHLTQTEIKKLIRTTQYIIHKLSDHNHKDYFEKWEFILLNCLPDFDKLMLKRIIRMELKQVDTLHNLHGISMSNIHLHLIDPIQKEFYNDFSSKTETHWVVLDECVGDLEDGYLIIYSEERNGFGLADKSSNQKSNQGSIVGWYGNFISTLLGM